MFQKKKKILQVFIRYSKTVLYLYFISFKIQPNYTHQSTILKACFNLKTTILIVCISYELSTADLFVSYGTPF